MPKLIPASLAALALAFGLSACGSDSSTSTGAEGSSTPTAAAPSATTPAAALTVVDPWAKTADDSKDEMSAVFGTLTNNTDADITVTGATTSVAGMTQLHETTQGSDGASAMQEKKDGFVVPANGTLELVPGGNHLMLMKLTAPIKAGDAVAITLTLKDGKTVAFEALAKDFAGAQESYAPEAESEHSEHNEGHSMGADHSTGH